MQKTSCLFTESVTLENSVPLLMLIEREMETEYGLVGRKRLFMFVVESLQNVAKHSDQPGMNDMSLVLYSKTGSGYTVTTVMLFPQRMLMSSERDLEGINKLDPIR